MSIAEKVRELTEPIARELNVEIWDVEFKKEGSEYYLRILIDRPDGGIWLSDCEEMAHKMNPLLDEYDFIEQSYNFEVNSAGLVRELKKTEHILRFTGKAVSVSLYKPDETLPVKSKKFNAVIINADEKSVIINLNGEEKAIDRKNISKIIIDMV